MLIIIQASVLEMQVGASGKMPVLNVIRYVGENNVPRNIRRQRGSNLDTMRRFGTPVVIKHMYNDLDVEEGVAETSPNFSSIYKQTRHDDPLSHGVGYVSIEKSDNEWVSPQGELVVADVSPGAGYTPAPKYRGYGPGHLAYIILPDVAEDVFKLSEVGVLIRTQTAQAQMGWYPEVYDNDLIILVQVDQAENVINTDERYETKMVTPASMRGLDRKGRREYTEDFGNQHVTDQSFQLVLLPRNQPQYQVPVDR